MYNDRYVTKLSISEVKEYYEILRRNRKLTHEESEDFGICKERLIAYAYKNIDKVESLIRTEILKAKQNITVGKEDYNMGIYVGLIKALNLFEDKDVESEETWEIINGGKDKRKEFEKSTRFCYGIIYRLKSYVSGITTG